MIGEPSIEPTPGGPTAMARAALLSGCGGVLLGVLASGGWYLGVSFLPLGVAAVLVAVLGLGGVILGPVALRDCERNRRPGSRASLSGLVAGAFCLPLAVLAGVLAYQSPIVGIVVG